MSVMGQLVDATIADHAFILGLSPMLANVANLSWHDDDVVHNMQDSYIENMLAPTEIAHKTLLYKLNGEAMGFIHVREHVDGISDEKCATIPLLAVHPKAQGLGVGKNLILAAETWAKGQGYRLLHLEVFANNNNAQAFYKHHGFKAEMLHMIKPLT